MPKFIPTFGGYSGPKPVLHIIAGTLILSALAWLGIQLAIVGFGPQINNGVNAQAVSINNTIYDYQWRLIGMAGALAASYYAARWPMSRSATFMAFMATITIALSFIPVDLKGNYQVLYYGIGRCANQGIDSKWCALQMGSQILSDVQTGLVLLLAMWAFARHLVADTYPHLVGSEHFSHILVWLGFAAYACWCGAAAVLNIDLNVDGDTAEFINQWNQPALHIASIAGLTLGAYVSWGSTRGARVNALLFSVVALHILAPAIAWDARMLWDSTYFPGDAYATSCTASFSNRLCLAKNAVVAGIGGVAGVFLVLSLNYVLLLATPVRGDVYAYNQPNAAAVKQEPEYVPANSNNYQASTTQAAYPSYDTAPAYGTPSNRYVASTTASPYPPV